MNMNVDEKLLAQRLGRRPLQKTVKSIGTMRNPDYPNSSPDRLVISFDDDTKAEWVFGDCSTNPKGYEFMDLLRRLIKVGTQI